MTHIKHEWDLSGCRWMTMVLLMTAPSSVIQGANCLQAPPGLVSFWPADGDANDLAGLNNGSLFNGTTFAPGEVGSAFSFDGVDDIVQIDASPIPAPWTAVLWVNRTDSSQD